MSEAQAQAILELRLNRLTGLEQDKIINEFQELLLKIKDLADILARAERLVQVIRDELLEIKATYADARRTEINHTHSDLTLEDLIEPQDVVVTLSHGGYAKSQPLADYQAQRRGGRGKAATTMSQALLRFARTGDRLLNPFCRRMVGGKFGERLRSVRPFSCRNAAASRTTIRTRSTTFCTSGGRCRTRR